MPSVDTNVDNVTVGKPKVGGSIYIAPVGTSLPTDAVTSLNEAFKCLGYVSEDGVVNNNTPESTDIKAWGGDTILSVQTSKDDSYQFTLVEAMNIDVLKFVYGSANVSGTLENGITINANSQEQEMCSIVIEMVFSGNVFNRVVIPKGKISEVGEIAYKDEDPVGYKTTVKCLPDSSGNTHYEYKKKIPSTSIVPIGG